MARCGVAFEDVGKETILLGVMPYLRGKVTAASMLIFQEAFVIDYQGISQCCPESS